MSGTYVIPDDQVPMTAAAALSKILLKAPVESTVRQPVSQDTILEEELELDDEEDGMDQNSTADFTSEVHPLLAYFLEPDVAGYNYTIYGYNCVGDDYQ